MSHEDIVNEALSGLSGISLKKARITIGLYFEPQNETTFPNDFEKYAQGVLCIARTLEEQSHRDLPRAEECRTAAKMLMSILTASPLFEQNFRAFAEAHKKRVERESA